MSAVGKLRDDRWRVALAFATSALTALCATGGLFTVAPNLQTGLLAGLAAGLVAPSAVAAALVAAAGAGTGVLLGPANAWFGSASFAARLGAAAVAVPAAVAIATLARMMGKRRGAWPKVIVGIAVALIVANLWVTTFDANDESAFDPISGTQMPSFWRQLDGDVPVAISASDDAWFFHVYERVRDGEPYYPVFAEALKSNPRWAPTSVTAFRMPTLFWLWKILLNGRTVAIAFLFLASVAVLCVIPIMAGIARTPLVLPACVALGSYFVYFSVQLPLFSQEAWAVSIGLGSLAAFAFSLRSPHWRAWVVTSVALAVLGTLIRETLVFLPLAGAVSAFIGRERRVFRIAAWLTGVIAFGAAYVAHYLATKPYVSASSGPSQFIRGGFGNVIAALTYATDMLGGGGILAIGLVLLGLAGALLVPDKSMRAFVSIATIVPLTAFLFLGNRAWFETSGERINYWGATVVPLMYALIPSALAAIPGAAVSRAGRLR